MKLSHSKLGCILNCPMTYYLNYVMGISKKDGKPALAIGGAVHWGIEHSTSDLTAYFNENGGFKSRDSYGREQLLSEAMVDAYLKKKDSIFDDILLDKLSGEKATLVEETHELYITANLKSNHFEDAHKFVGIVDLLLLTDKGFVIIDYKTSTYEPDWNGYLDQIYRYVYLLKDQFPDIPIFKIGIINIRKAGIRQKKHENWNEFLARLKFEYEVDESLVGYHEYLPQELDNRLIEAYIANLSNQADVAQLIADNQTFYINYGSAVSQYGKSDYWDIFYQTDSAHLLYSISDEVYDKETKKIVYRRDCVPIDMKVIFGDENILNKYEKYKKIAETFVIKELINEECKRRYSIVDDSLLDLYYLTFINYPKCK